jgi:hypothetical protein
MAHIANQVRTLFMNAEDYFHAGFAADAIAFYMAGTALLPQVGHPLDYLELVLEQETLLRRYVVPNMMTT